MSKPLVISRVFSASPATLFSVHTEVAHLARWMAPAGLTVLKADLDLRPGGSYHYGMRTPDGHEMWGLWKFVDVKAPERLVVETQFSDANRGVIRHPMSATWPLYTLSTTTFAPEGAGTRLTITWQPHNATPEEAATFAGAHDNMRAGWDGTFAKLEAYLTTL
jgi:uncharacterized protein YndB with AHSA1/START domain